MSAKVESRGRECEKREALCAPTAANIRMSRIVVLPHRSRKSVVVLFEETEFPSEFRRSGSSWPASWMGRAEGWWRGEEREERAE